MAAQQALSIVNNGDVVDNLVLVGPSINESLAVQLFEAQDQGGIGQLHVIELVNDGDPIFFGMSDVTIALSIPTLVSQMPINRGHFYLSGSGEEGARRRDEFARLLVDERGVGQ